ncbi:MAG TPA: bifunctional phosphoribosylaminoimidazolecarboxamide formyltransferase/IMP cyclohydrolase [Pyrinomonadaceae bacterium]|nr:bifunctional phosphoribosylaminoimidazolecarboxamide formyltransferase/IMP cyclohydrolase [Pyrinomonadaceae bacterium]
MNSETNLKPIKRALLSVSNKAGIVEFAQALQSFGVEIISTGGTAKNLREAGVKVRDISDLTGFPEMMDGRVKTLHPRVHGGLLGQRENPSHVAAMAEHGIEPIDLVVVNLYPFGETISRPGVTESEAIEQIDIGGPSMIRSAAKNFNDVVVLSSPKSYERVLAELRTNGGSTTLHLRRALAAEAFQQTATYDRTIAEFFDEQPQELLPAKTTIGLNKVSDLRYGENPHQTAALYRTDSKMNPEDCVSGLANAQLLSGKEMSFNNYVDADAAWQLVCDFSQPACAIIKHTNPAGVGLGPTLAESYKRALATDPVSAFGGIVAFNRKLDEEAASEAAKIFTEVIIAPDYDPAALETLQKKKNLRVLKMSSVEQPAGLEYRQISGGVLVQSRDNHKLERSQLKVVTARQPTDAELNALLFAWIVCKHTKSNAIVYAIEGQTVGVGAGQMSRVDSVKIGAMRAQLPIAGSVLASDAFFPFRDGVDEAAKSGITAIIQPGGSVRDEEVIAAANEHGLAMVFTGIRHFRH